MVITLFASFFLASFLACLFVVFRTFSGRVGSTLVATPLVITTVARRNNATSQAAERQRRAVCKYAYVHV
jgi:hypothetical protein